MNKKQVLAFDFGASSGRCILGTLENGQIKMEEVHRFSNDPVLLGGTMHWDILRLLYEIKQGILKAKHISDFQSIGIDTWGVDFGLLDEQGVLLENPIHYRDDRTLGMQEEVFKEIDRETLYKITGNQIENFNTIFQLYSLAKNRPWVLERADKLLLIPDLFNYFLTGVKNSEYSIATTTQLMDVVNKQWSHEVLEKLNIPKKILPEIISTGKVLGTVNEEICNELGIRPVKVISVAEHDTQSAVIAVPTNDDDFIFISSGTWSLFGTEISSPIINEEAIKYNLSNEGGYGNTITLLKNIVGLWLVQESRRQWQREGKEYSFSELEKMAQSATPFKSFIDPDAPEFVASGNIPKRIKEFCKKTGQKVPETESDIILCINQSLALKYRYTMSQIEICTNKKYNSIHMIGGGIQSKLLCQMTASANGKKVIAGPVEATALGNIAVQFIALGEIKDIKEARKIISNSEDTKVYEPQNENEWSKAYELFKTIIIQ